jgi:site-specific recombinase XerD
MKAKIKAKLFPKTYSNGDYPIFIRIGYKGKYVYLKAGYSVPSGSWDEEKSEVWESVPNLTKKMKESLPNDEIEAFKVKQKGIVLLPNAVKINSEIRKLIAKLEAIETKLSANDEDISAEIIKTRAENRDMNENAKLDFLQYIQKVADTKHSQRQIRTAEKYNVMLRKLKSFLKNKPLPMEKVTTGFLKDFQQFLQKDGKHQNYIHVNLKALKTIIQKEAIAEDKVFPANKNPFIGFSMPKVLPSDKERLDLAEIEKIEALIIPETDIHFHIRNIFLFSLYNAGIRVGDLLQLKWVNIIDGRLKYFMGKTGKERSIPLLPQSLKILKIYEAKKENENDYIFPFLDNKAAYSKLTTPEDFQKVDPALLAFLFKKIESRISVINSGLKDIAKDAKIAKNISSHVARHSFADIARKKGVSVYDISNMLGHSKISVTQGYLDSLDFDSMDNAMSSIFEEKRDPNAELKAMLEKLNPGELDKLLAEMKKVRQADNLHNNLDTI